MRSSRLSANLKQTEKDISAKSKALEDAITKPDLQFLGVLRIIYSLLIGHQTMTAEDKTRDALIYIQNIKIESDNMLSTMFMPNEYFSDYLAEKKHPLLMVKNREPSMAVVLTEVQKKYLAEIHTRLIHLIPHWQYTFQLDQNGEVTNAAIAEWQRMQMKVREDVTIIDDYARAITIRGEYGDEALGKVGGGMIKGTVESNVKKKINDLVIDAKGYLDKDKASLINWLTHNGGQDNTRFVDLCFGSGCFSPQGKKFRIGSVEKESVMQNWDINSAGKICFHYDVFINTLSLEEDPQAGCYVKLDTGLVEFRDDLEEVKDQQKLGKLLPLARVMASVELDVVNGKVKPKVVKFVFDNYASSKLFLVRPDLVEQNMNEEHSFYNRLGH